MTLFRHVVSSVILGQDVTKKRGWIEIVFGQVFPKEFTAAHYVPFAHREELQSKSRPFTIISKDVNVALWRGSHLLLFRKFDDSLPQVAILGGHLVTQLSRSLA